MENERFADRLKQVRIKAGLTQKQLAEAAGVTDAIVGIWESGKAKPSTKNLEMICNLLGVDMAWLLQGDLRPQNAVPFWIRQVLNICDKFPMSAAFFIMALNDAIENMRKFYPKQFDSLVSIDMADFTSPEKVVIETDSERERPPRPKAG